MSELYVIFGTGPLGKWTARELVNMGKHVHGIVSLEIAGNQAPFGASGNDLLYEMDSIVRQFIKE